MIATEHELAALAFALLGREAAVTTAERRVVPTKAPSRTLIANTRASVAQGTDPLGSRFCELRSSQERRNTGATYTPLPIVDAMAAWAAGEGTPARIVDPGAGSGRFLIRAAELFPAAALIAIDIDPLATLILRANAAVLGFADRLTVHLADYRKLELPAIEQPTLFIGNPPYVRHHDIGGAWKTWFADTARELGFSASKLAGLHIHFFLKTRQIGRPGDFGAFITAAEWIDVNYGSVLRRMLADGLGGTALHVIDPKARPFADALTTGAITCFRVGRRPNAFTVRKLDTLDQLTPLTAGRAVPWSEIDPAPKWSFLVRETRAPDPHEMELGELFRVHRGQVTGGNAVWIENPAAPAIPERFLLRAITRARELIAAGLVLDRADHLKRVIDLPVALDCISAAERRAIERFLAWAKRFEADRSYIARHRRAWWSVGCRAPAPILCTYMARRPPHFLRNAAGARHINIAHGLYPHENLSTDILDRIVRLLSRGVTGEGGRVYAGGLIKFEPKELERLRVPRLDRIHDDDCDQMDSRTVLRRRGSDERAIFPLLRGAIGY